MLIFVGSLEFTSDDSAITHHFASLIGKFIYTWIKILFNMGFLFHASAASSVQTCSANGVVKARNESVLKKTIVLPSKIPQLIFLLKNVARKRHLCLEFFQLRHLSE